MSYYGRPGLSPVNAALVLSGAIPKGARVLEVGAGQGTETIELAKLGFRVVGTDEKPVGWATRRAHAEGVGRRATFLQVNALGLAEAFEPASFDVVVDVLTYNNVKWHVDGRPRDAALYVEQVAHVLRDGGVWSVQWRAGNTHDAAQDRRIGADLPRSAAKWFNKSGPLWTHIPEYRTEHHRQGFAPVAAALLTRRPRA